MTTTKTYDVVEAVVELIRRASTELPKDVIEALHHARDREAPGSPAQQALDAILKNVRLAHQKVSPICQDTGTLVFEVHHPFCYSTRELRHQIESATAKATELAYLRPNAVDPITGKNSGNNLGIESPFIHFEEWGELSLRIDLLLKGGGSENCGAQYKLPEPSLKADRDLDGVKRVVLHAIHAAQGKGCSPGVIGVGIGGDRVSSFWVSKKQLFRPLGDRNSDPVLAQLEDELYEKSNRLGIGPMGFGGATTTLGVKVGKAHRLPASYFVSISYMCWADRRASVTLQDDEVTYD